MSYQPEQGMDLPGYSTTVVFWKSKALVNPGSVGQPRDGDPQASYGILDIDAGTFSFGSVGYDVETVQKAIYAAGLPAVMAHRLALGS
jgi:diadenosine tetraphosphatase ApaH/serine/threonine PP2A family protein phosphatase